MSIRTLGRRGLAAAAVMALAGSAFADFDLTDPIEDLSIYGVDAAPIVDGPAVRSHLESTVRDEAPTTGASAIRSEILAVTPAPGAIALLGLAGLAAGRRRRG